MTRAQDIIDGVRQQTGQTVEVGAAFSAAVADEATRLRVREAAAQQVRQQRAGVRGALPAHRLDEFLDIVDEEATYRIEGLWPTGGRVVLAAARKAGKTTVLGNLIRSLVDGDTFLGRYGTRQTTGRVVLIDDELDERMLRRWLREQGIAHTDRVVVVPLRGRVADLDLLDTACRTRWAALLREHNAEVLILDCLRPVLDSLGLSEDKDAGRFLVALDALLAEAGISEAVVSHHMGHNGERSRGDSRLRDWPDAEWRVVREQTDDEHEDDASARRYLTATGRDVAVSEALLSYDPASRRLTVGGGTRRQEKLRPVVEDVVELLGEAPGLSQRATEERLKDSHPRDEVRAALHQLLREGRARVEDGPRRAKMHYLCDLPEPDISTVESSVRGSARPVRERTESECASALLERTAHSHADTPLREAGNPAHSQSDPDDWIVREAEHLRVVGG